MKTAVSVFLLLSHFDLCICYRKHFYVNQSMAWLDAQKYCREHHDDLSTISKEELKTLSKNPEIISDFYWIGLQRDPNTSSKWTWSGGEAATIDNWDNGEPSNNNELCGLVSKITCAFHDCSCSRMFSFYCMEVYELILVKQKNTWEEALDYCRQHYIDLAILSSEEMMAEAKIVSTEAQTDEVWIGLRFLAGHWFWVNGEDLQYKAWSVGGQLQCPAMNQRCGVYHRKEIVWKPEDCKNKLNFICVKKKYVNPT